MIKKKRGDNAPKIRESRTNISTTPFKTPAKRHLIPPNIARNPNLRRKTTRKRRKISLSKPASWREVGKKVEETFGG